MKLSRRQLRKLILREFKMGSNSSDFNFDDLDLLGGDPPPPEAPQERGGGGGSNKIHQLVRVDFSPNSEYNPASYTKIPIDMGPGTPFAKMKELYDSFSNQTKNALYQMFPGGVDPESEDSDNIWLFRNAYTDLLNTMDDAVPMDRDYEYFTVFHPSYASHGGEADEGQRKALDLYKAVTGYTPDEALLNDYEIIMHSAAAMY